MKTILVLTDFSSSNEHTVAYAANLAKVAGASVLLFHAYQLPLPVNDMPLPMVSADELKKSADAGLQGVKTAAEAIHGNVTFDTESRLGDAVEEAAELGNERKILATVVGTKKESEFDRLLFGNIAESLVKKCNGPVILVPEDAPITAPKNVALAVDLLHANAMPADEIKQLVQTFQATLQLVHVETENEAPADPANLLAALQLPPSAYHSLKERDVAEGIKQFVTQNNIDLLLILPHKHRLFERLFFKGHTHDILTAATVPVMTLRDA